MLRSLVQVHPGEAEEVAGYQAGPPRSGGLLAAAGAVTARVGVHRAAAGEPGRRAMMKILMTRTGLSPSGPGALAAHAKWSGVHCSSPAGQPQQVLAVAEGILAIQG